MSNEESYKRLKLIDTYCGHAAGDDCSVEVANYKPLTKTELIDLLDLAYQFRTNGGSAVSKIQIRLSEAIPGMTCPLPGEGPVADKINALGEYFVANYKKGATDSNVYRISQILGIPTL